MKKLLLLFVVLQLHTVYAMDHKKLLACQINCLKLFQAQANKTDRIVVRLHTLSQKDVEWYIMTMSNHAQIFNRCLRLCALKYNPQQFYKDLTAGHRSPRYFEDEE